MSQPINHPTQSVADPDATTGGDAPASVLPVLAVTERYLIGAEIARGGMGVVYRATDTTLGREVAVKVLLDRYAPGSGTARRFADEARITGQLQHPGIPPVHDLGTLPDGRPFLAMKLIKGDTLDELLKQRSDPAANRGRLVAVFEGVCQAVAYAHAHKVIHRDLKPGNVMVGAFGEVQVMDWGLAKVLGDGRPTTTDDPDTTAAGSSAVVGSTRDSEDLLTQAGSVLGTPAYMPPEQAIGAVHEVDRRSDVFGLGGILAAVLTGRPPFIGDTAETTRVQAARGEVQGCFERLDECEVDPGLLALAKRCLAPRREDRPADAGEVAAEVAMLRAEADDRLRQAEVKLATTAAASGERRKRQRVWLGAAVALAVAVVGGLGAVLAVQQRANADLAVANGALAAKNDALEAERAKVEQRFGMARKAIAAFHTTIDELPELGNEAFRPLRKNLLGSAAGFYRELEALLANETDPKSRAALADGYFQLAELTNKIEDEREALAVLHKALAIRRELAAAPGADVPTRLAVSVTLRRIGILTAITGDTTGAQQLLAEARASASALEAEAPTTAVRQALAGSHQSYGWLLARLGQYPEELAEYRKALPIRQRLAEAHPEVPEYQSDLATIHRNIGLALRDLGQPAEALAEYREALALLRRLADAHPAVAAYHSKLSDAHNSIGVLLSRTRRYPEALAAHKDALAVRQRLVDVYPAVTEYQSDLAQSHDNIGIVQRALGQSAEGLAAHKEALAVRQRLADAHPAVTTLQSELADSHHNTAIALSQIGLKAEALVAFERSLAVRQRLADANPAVTEYQSDLASSHNNIGITLQDLGKPAEALAAFKRSLAFQQQLADAQPSVTEYQSYLASAEDNIGRLLAKEGRFAEAFDALEAGLAVREKLVLADTKSTKYTSSLGFSHAHRGWARVRASQPKEAADDLRKALKLWAENSAPDAEIRFETARALALLAKLGADPKSGVTADEVKMFADQAVVALTDAIKAGSGQLKELKEPDFVAVRDRADFQKLIVELEAKAPKPPDVAPSSREKK